MQNAKSLSDEVLVEHVRSIDQELYREVILRYQNKLMRYAIYLLGHEQEAADVVQDSLIKAFVNLHGFDTQKKFSSWIYRIVHNEAMNYIAKRKKTISLEANDWISETATSDENVEEVFDKKQIQEKIKRCLEKLPLAYREVLTLFYLEDKSYDEIGDILKIPIGTVGTKISRGKKIVKELYLEKDS